jgi:hypothetical protein
MRHYGEAGGKEESMDKELEGLRARAERILAVERALLYSWKGKDYYMTPMRPMTSKEIRRAELHLKELEDASAR